MSRQARAYEKTLFEISREFKESYYFQKISKLIEEENFKISIEKDKGEMVARVKVTNEEDSVIEYELMYNRLINVTEGYTLLVPEVKNET